MAIRTCPKCASSTVFQRVPDLPPHASGHVIDEAPSFAANPETIQCTGCGGYWHESELNTAGASFAHLRSEYAKRA
jgi:hypothetical protein